VRFANEINNFQIYLIVNVTINGSSKILDKLLKVTQLNYIASNYRRSNSIIMFVAYPVSTITNTTKSFIFYVWIMHQLQIVCIFWNISFFAQCTLDGMQSKKLFVFNEELDWKLVNVTFSFIFSMTFYVTQENLGRNLDDLNSRESNSNEKLLSALQEFLIHTIHTLSL